MPFRRIKNYIISGQKWSIKLFFSFLFNISPTNNMISRCFVAFYPKIILICVDLNFWSHIWCYIFPSNICAPKKTSLIDVELKSDFTDLQNIKHFTQIQFHYKLIFSPRRSNFTRRIQKLQEKAIGPPIVWGGPWTLGSRVPIGRQGWKRDHWLVGISKVKLAMRDQVGRNTEYLPTIHLIVIKME